MLRFHGNEICCGSYACLNAMEDQGIDVQLFEISTSTPFGIRHIRNSLFDHLLTVYCDPNQKLDDTIRIWGYDAVPYSFESVEGLIDALRLNLLQMGPAVLGPIDMGEIRYLIMPELLKRMDHYIALKYRDADTVLCIDSEGISGRYMSYQELAGCVSVKDLYEAKGKITVRFIKKREEYQLKHIMESSYRYACENLRAAEKEGSGSNAVWECFEYISCYDKSKWRLPLLYDLEYLLQRKYLLLLLLEKSREYEAAEEVNLNKIKFIAVEQLTLLGQMYKRLMYLQSVEEAEFRQLSALEARLSNEI